MPIDRNNKIIFIYILKTAGTSIEQMLNINWRKNKPPNYKSLFGITNDNFVLQTMSINDISKYINNLNEYYIFTIVRNPYSRAVLDYKWLQRGFKSFYEYLKNIENIIEKTQKYSDLNYIVNTEQMYGTNHYIPQWYFIENNKNIKINIFKFENLKEDIKQLYNNFHNTKFKLKHLNKTKKNNFMEYYDEKCIKIINKCYERDFIQFKYKMII